MLVRFLLLILLSSVGLFADSQEQAIVQRVQQIIEASHSPKGKEVWPGYDLTHAPVLATFSNGHLYAFNLKSSEAIWKQQGSVKYSETDPWGVSQMAMNPAFFIEGQSAFAFNFDPMVQNPEMIAEIFIHEQFHPYQFAHFPQPQEMGHYVDHLNIQNLALMQLEERALAQFLREKNIDVLRDYLAINQMRRALLAPSSIVWEDHQQVMEGLADYISHRFLDVFPIIPGYDGQRKIAGLLEHYAADPNILERAIKWRHYGVGAALGYALDFLQVKNWKGRVEKGESLTEILVQALPISSQQGVERLDRIAITHHLRETIEAVSTSVNSFERELGALLEAYKELDGVIVQIGQPLGQEMSGGGMSARTIYLADGSTVSLQDTSSMALPDDSWKMQVREMPYIFQTQTGLREFKAEGEMEVILDGVTQNLKDLVRTKNTRKFSTIMMRGKNSRFMSNGHAGQCKVQPDGKVKITFF